MTLEAGARLGPYEIVAPHEIPFRSEQPEVRRWYAQMLLERDRPGDRDRAAILIDEAIQSYAAIGMPRHLEMAQALRARL